MLSRRPTLLLLILALVLPIILVIVLGVERLLTAMEDHAAAIVFERFALILAIIWIVVLVLLVILQAMTTVFDGYRHDE